jgi:hypothetical protein
MNGWINHETWLVNLWLGDSFVEQAEDGQKITEDFIRQTVYCLHDSVQNLDPLMADLLSTAIGSINYREIAKHYVSDHPTVEDDEENLEIDLDGGLSAEDDYDGDPDDDDGEYDDDHYHDYQDEHPEERLGFI